MIAYTEQGQIIDTFVSRINNGHVRIKAAAYSVHGISSRDLREQPTFTTVGKRLNTFFNAVLTDFDAGILVAHNGSTDFQFLSCDYLRAGLTIPTKITHTICTLQTLRRFKTLAYHKGPIDEWTVLTDKGNRSLCVNAAATFVLSKRDPPSTFESFCGRHHEALADVKGVGVIFFDQKVVWIACGYMYTTDVT